MPGPRRQTLEPIADALLKEAVPPASRETHAAGMRRLLHVAMTRARDAARARLPGEDGPRRGAAAVGVRRGGAGRGRRRVGSRARRSCSGPTETLQSTFRLLRDELLTTVGEVGGRLGELRFDTDLDVSHAVVRYLELLKLSALLERTRSGELSVEEALPDINARLLQASTSEQREIFETSALDEYLLDAERDEQARARAVAKRNEPSLEPFLPAPRRRAAAQRHRHRVLPDVPAEVQVRARLPDSERADDQPALRHPRPPGARALPRRDRGRPARAARAAGGGLAARRLRRLRGGAPVPRQGDVRAGPLPRPLQGGGGRAGVVRALLPVPDGQAPAARARGPRRPAPGRRLRADRLQDRAARRPRPSCARTSSCRCTRSARASRGSSTPPRSPTTTCSTTRRCRSSAPRPTATGSPRP